MHKIALLAGGAILALSFGAASSSAFAMGCLNTQNQVVTPSLSDNVMTSRDGFTGEGEAYDPDALNQVVAQGNSCGTTQQSLPINSGNDAGITHHHVEPYRDQQH